MRLRLFVRDLPPNCCEEDWTHRQIKGDIPVYLYNHMALYVFGGEIYDKDHENHLNKRNPHNISATNVSFIFLGPSVKPRKSAPKRRALDE